MGQVIPLFPSAPPAAEQSSVVEQFTEQYLCHFMALVQQLGESTTEQEFRESKALVEADVRGWPPL